MAATLPTLVAQMGVHAPRAGVELVAPAPGMLRDVAEGRLDVAIAPTSRRHEGLERRALAALEWAVFARADHPAVRAWSAQVWASYPHVRIRTPSDSESPVDKAAHALGLERRAGPVLPHFMLAPPLLARTELLMTVPRAILSELAPRFELVALPCPVPLAPIELSMFWSAQLDRDPALVWFRGTLAAACAAFRD